MCFTTVFEVFTPEELQGGFLSVFNLLFGQFSDNLSDDVLARFLTRVLTKVLGRGKSVNTVYSTIPPKEKT